LPREIIEKKKHGFGLPFGEWLNASEPLRSVIFDSLSTLHNKRIVRKDFLDSLTNDQRHEHAKYYGGSIWIFAMFSRWLTAHAVDV
jgi:asparagine synthase (glutamine-hydrolysing)